MSVFFLLKTCDWLCGQNCLVCVCSTGNLVVNAVDAVINPVGLKEYASSITWYGLLSAILQPTCLMVSEEAYLEICC